MPSSQQQPQVILLLEEEPSIREALVQHLQEAGFVVIEAADSDAALAQLKGSSAIHGLVADAHVPGKIDGFELADQARKRWPDLAVVMMSGHSDESSGPVPAGAEFIAKPYLSTHLAPALNRLLGRIS